MSLFSKYVIYILYVASLFVCVKGIVPYSKIYDIDIYQINKFKISSSLAKQ